MARIHLIHWNAEEASSLLTQMRRAKHQVIYEERPDYTALRRIREGAPDAIVIDLSRLPSHGREVAIGLRSAKATRHLPIVFVDGDPVKVAAIAAKLPDAVYTTADRLSGAIQDAIAHPPVSPVVPPAMMDRYAGKTAAQKLGIREMSVVALIDPPRDYAKVIGPLPSGASLEEGVPAACDVALWFVEDAGEYRAALPRRRSMASGAKFWILWRKQRGRAASEVNERLIRDCALDMGLVDYKVCSVDETWSALLFARK